MKIKYKQFGDDEYKEEECWKFEFSFLTDIQDPDRNLQTLLLIFLSPTDVFEIFRVSDVHIEEM